jgi:predicted nucleic acid-binding protein
VAGGLRVTGVGRVPLKLRVVLDTNVVLNAVKALSSLDDLQSVELPSEGQRLESLLVLALAVFSCKVEPVAGPTLLDEYRSHLRRLEGRCGSVSNLLKMLKDECRVVEPREDFVRACQKAHPKNDPADAEHAAVCIQEGAKLVSLDVHFRIMAYKLERRGMSLEVYDPSQLLSG